MQAATNTVTPITIRKLTPTKRADLALNVLRGKKPITELANENAISRQSLYRDQHKIVNLIHESFTPKHEANEVLFNLPVTKDWLTQFVLCLELHCHGLVRAIKACANDLLDYHLSEGSISGLSRESAARAETLNTQECLHNITIASHDEKFHHGMPVLATCDLESLYCAGLSIENDRDGDTWSIRMMELEDRGFAPDRIIADDADGIRVGHQTVMPTIPFDLDNFHITKTLMECRRYFRNRLKSSLLHLLSLEAKMDKAKLKGNTQQHARQLGLARTAYSEALELSQTLDTLISWLERDVFFMPGDEPNVRFECFDFIVDELLALAKQHPHRLQAICTTLQNQREQLLAFTFVLDKKFNTIATQFQCSPHSVWQMCQLMRYSKTGSLYYQKERPLRQQLKKHFYPIEQAVKEAVDTTHRASSLIENFNSRLSPYFFLRKNIDNRFLQLLRFYFNHRAFTASEHPKRKNKSPAQLLHQKKHPHWLEMLGHQRFRRAA